MTNTCRHLLNKCSTVKTRHESGNDRIQVFDSEGRFLRKWGVRGIGDGEFNQLEGVAIDSLDAINDDGYDEPLTGNSDN